MSHHWLKIILISDREPSSTVIIKTPDINLEEPEPVNLWKGSIVMADVAKFSGIATEISGDCAGLSYDIGDKVDVVGRIPFVTVFSLFKLCLFHKAIGCCSVFYVQNGDFRFGNT